MGSEHLNIYLLQAAGIESWPHHNVYIIPSIVQVFYEYNYASAWKVPHLNIISLLSIQ
jgi:hypothetical protein